MYVRVLCECLVPADVRMGHQLPWNWSYTHTKKLELHDFMSLLMWMLGFEPLSSTRAASAFN